MLDLDDSLLIEAAVTENLSESAWFDKFNRRSLTREESSKLKVPKAELSCSVMYFEPKRAGGKGGYAAFTHRASSGFYDTPEDIPVAKLKFISSTS